MRIVYILFLLMTYSYLWADISPTPVSKLPDRFKNYQVTDRLEYTGEDLFEYINGGAEIYLSYGFVGMKGYKYNAEGLPQVTVEVYEMTEAKNAYGVFTQSRDKEEADYGQGSQTYNDAILFWKDRYFVTVNTHEVTPESQEAVRHLATLINLAIPGKGEVPSIMNHIPRNELVPGGYLYFHHYIWLNSYYFIADYNIIDINAQTDALLAKYGSADERRYLLLVEYADDASARKALEGLSGKFAPEGKEGESIRLEDNTWFRTWRKGNILGAIFNGASAEDVNRLYQDTLNNM